MRRRGGACEAADVARAAGDDRRAGRGGGAGRADRLAGVPRLQVAPGRRSSASCSCRSAGRARSISPRSTGSMPTRTCSAFWTRRPGRSTTTSRIARSRSSRSSSRRSRNRSAPIAEAGLESDIRRRGAGARRGDGQDLECRCTRAGAARVADADHGAEGRRRGQGVQRGVRAVSSRHRIPKGRPDSGKETTESTDATEATEAPMPTATDRDADETLKPRTTTRPRPRRPRPKPPSEADRNCGRRGSGIR